MKKDLTGFIRGLIIVFLGATALFNMSSGIGTTCLAFDAASYPPFKKLADYATFYQASVYLYTLAGFALVIITYAFIRAEKWAFWSAVGVVLVSGVYSVIHVYLSRMLRGSSLPNDIRMIADIATLIVLIIVRLPFIWNKIDLTKKPEGDASYAIPTGAAFLVSGILLFFVPMMSASSHTIDGVNLAATLQPQINIIASLLVVIGGGLIALVKLGFNPDTWVVSTFRRITKAEVGGAK
ncbi:MAG: hypothetical protein WDA53_09250 [Bacillota bacterium]